MRIRGRAIGVFARIIQRVVRQTQSLFRLVPQRVRARGRQMRLAGRLGDVATLRLQHPKTPRRVFKRARARRRDPLAASQFGVLTLRFRARVFGLAQRRAQPVQAPLDVPRRQHRRDASLGADHARARFSRVFGLVFKNARDVRDGGKVRIRRARVRCVARAFRRRRRRRLDGQVEVLAAQTRALALGGGDVALVPREHLFERLGARLQKQVVSSSELGGFQRRRIRLRARFQDARLAL